MSAPPPALELREVVKRYGAAAALGPVSLAVPRGRSLALVGPSGSGKSTALRLMMGLAVPDQGEVRFHGELLRPGDWSRRQRMGYVVQGGGLFPHLTAAGNVTVVARHLGWEPGRMASRLRELAELARLEAGLLGRHPAELSGGQAQRVSLMRALMLEPDVLLLDEPLGALDPITRSELQQDLRRIFQALGKTVVLVTHDVGEAAFFAHRLALLRDGRILQEGTWSELCHAPADSFVTRFLRAQLPPPAAEGSP